MSLYRDVSLAQGRLFRHRDEESPSRTAGSRTASMRHSDLFGAVIEEALTAGTVVRFRAEGTSMCPTIRDGEIISVAAVSIDEIVRGDVLLCRHAARVLAHRVVGVTMRGRDRFFELRGDAKAACDASVGADAVVGRVVAVGRSGRRARWFSDIISFQFVTGSASFGPSKSRGPMDHDSLVVQHADDRRSFVTRQIAGDTLIVPVTGHVMDLESIYVLNPVGSRIWELLRSPTTIDRIAEIVSGEFAVSAAEAADDVVEFLESLRARGLIQQLTEGA
jgi:hypothetical protein